MENDAPPNPLESVLSGDKDSLAGAGGGLAPEEVIGDVEHVAEPAEKAKGFPLLRLPTASSAHLLGAGFGSTVQTDSMTAVGPLPPVNAKKPAMGLSVAKAPKGLDIDTLLAEAGKITDKTRLMYFFKNPKEDQLKKGPMGMNINTYELKPSAVGEDTAPRFFLVMFSYFTEGKGLTKDLIDKWAALFAEINEACVDDEDLKKSVIRAVDKVTRKFASEAFFVIDSMQCIQRSILKLGKSKYEVRSVISNFIDKFMTEVDTCINDVVEADTDIKRKMWNIKLTSEKKVLPDEEDSLSDEA